MFAPQRPLVGRIVLVLGAILALVLVFFAVNTIGSCVAGGFHKVKWGITTSEDIHYDLRATDVASFEKNSAITGVGLGDGDESFSVNESDVGELIDAVYKVEKTAHCGFILLDIQTGRALVYNPTESMYCASAVKAPLCYYALTHPAGGTSGLTDEERKRVENAIVWSSNEDYFALCETYFKEPYLNWIASYGVKYNAEQDGNFPSMSTESLGALWVEIYQYISGSSSDEKWLNGLFEKTEESFIRTALKNEKVTVRDKAGWISDGTTDAVTDAGIVTKDGRDYLMVVVTGQRDTDKGHKNVEELIQALFAKRGLLAPSISLTC